MRDQEDVAKPPNRADGLVLVRIFLTRPPRPLQQGGFAAFSWCRVHPSSAEEGSFAWPRYFVEPITLNTTRRGEQDCILPE